MREDAGPQLPRDQARAETHLVMLYRELEQHVFAPASDPQGLGWEVQETRGQGFA